MDGDAGRGTRFGRVLVATLTLAAVLVGVSGGVTRGESDRARRTEPVAAVQAACPAPGWSPSATYKLGAVVSHNGHQWRANHDMWPGMEPGNSGSPPWWIPWADLGACSATTTSSTTTTSTTAPTSTTTTVPSGQRVEDRFRVRGPSSVTTQSVTVPGATLGPVLLFYPANLGAGGVDHPILTSAAGTGWTVRPDDALANHLASWGYVVAAISSTGAGVDAAEADSMRAAAQWLVSQNGTSGSVFAGKLDTTAIGALGHSQGANATMMLLGSSRNADRLFSAAAPLALPDRTFGGGTGVDYSQIDEPIVFFSGGSDFLTSPGEQTFFFNQVRGAAGKATAVGKDHNAMIAATFGYLTAWFEYTLGGDTFARRAFVGNPPEITTTPATWTNWAGKNLP